MAKQPVLPTVTTTYLSSTQIDDAFRAIEDAFDNTLSLDGSTPNSMAADLDLDGNDILNAGTITAVDVVVGGDSLADLADDAAAAAASASAASSSASAASTSASSAATSLSQVQAIQNTLPEWRGPWVTATSYGLGDIFQEAGSSYITIVAHTSGVFATDLAAAKMQLLAQKGAAGAGTGDMLGANNLSDVANAATARGNLGLGSIATQASTAVSISGGAITGITDLAVADGGTGASTASAARTSLGLVIGTNVQAQGATLTALEALSLVAGDTLYATGADAPTRLAIGTAGQVLRVNSGATAPEWYTPGGPTVIETITATGASVATSDFVAGYSYRIKFRGVGHNSGSNQYITAAFYGATAAAYTSAVQICEGFSGSSYFYGEFIIRFPVFTSNVHTLIGHGEPDSISSASDVVKAISDGGQQGGVVNYATAQTVTKLRFAPNGGSFDTGTIIVERF